ncbi:MAG: hypothetical protein HY808_03650 [Nitrospirae bacterium]|nr:hypothetical protein [Nitrospirota bacterium]
MKKNQLYTILLIIFLFPFSTINNAQEPLRFGIYEVKKENLNHPISPYQLYFLVSTHYGGEEFGYYVRVIIQKKQKIIDDGLNITQIKTQILPTFYKWQLRSKDGITTHQWLAYFMRNRDGTYHTIVSLPIEDLKRSWLTIFIEDIENDNEREDVTFHLDMAGYDWPKKSGEIIQK